MLILQADVKESLNDRLAAAKIEETPHCPAPHSEEGSYRSPTTGVTNSQSRKSGFISPKSEPGVVAGGFANTSTAFKKRKKEEREK